MLQASEKVHGAVAVLAVLQPQLHVDELSVEKIAGTQTGKEAAPMAHSAGHLLALGVKHDIGGVHRRFTLLKAFVLLAWLPPLLKLCLQISPNLADDLLDHKSNHAQARIEQLSLALQTGHEAAAALYPNVDPLHHNLAQLQVDLHRSRPSVVSLVIHC